VVRPHEYIAAGDHELVLFEVISHQRQNGPTSLAFYDHHFAALTPIV
jgi:hypothetical protein